MHRFIDLGRAGALWLGCGAAVLLDVPQLRADEPVAEPNVAKAPVEAQFSVDVAVPIAITRGVDFLLQAQNDNGSWGSATRTKNLNIYAPVPGAHHAFRTATTSLCIMALVEAGDARSEVVQAIERGEQWLVDQLPRLRRATGDALYNVWGHAYAIQALVQLHERLPPEHPRRKQLIELVENQIERLQRYAFVNGGWGYYDFNAQTQQPSGSPASFTTGTVLVALSDAKKLGVKLPEKMVAKAIASIDRQRKPDFSYAYGEYLRFLPMHVINRPGGSLGRSQVCNLALRLFGDKTVTDEVLKTWLTRLIDRNGWLSMGRKKPIPHESFMAVAGYFYFYGHYYAGLCLDQLPEADRAKLAARLAATICPLQEKDGSWWDYPLYNYHQPYGTAFAILTLVHCR